jgi:hypothetical protein
MVLAATASGIPSLNDAGLLPPGVHPCTLDELKERFGGFRDSDRRPTLFSRLAELVAELRASALFSAVIVDGSFVTSKPDPNDIDLVLVLHPDHDMKADLPPYQANLLSRNFIKNKWKFDAFVVPAASEALDKYVDFFQQVKGSDATKGILRVLP